MSSPQKNVPQETPEERLLFRVLRGENSPWPANTGAGFARALLDTCSAEGVGPLVHYWLRRTPAGHDWPAVVREPLLHEARVQAALDIVRERELIAVLAALAAMGIPTLLLKGAALAYSHYPDPALRTRCDNDVLIRPDDHDAAAHLLESLGYRRPNAVTGELVSYEACYAKRDGDVDHVVDLHWQINNGQVFARALGFEEASARSVPVAPLGASARALCPPHALLLACMHRAAHLGVDGPKGSRLIWLYDIHLLANGLSAAGWQDFMQACAAKNMRWVCLDAFTATHRAFATAFPGDVIDSLAEAGVEEISAAYLEASRAQVLLTDLRALGSWRARATLLREVVFPPADYLLAKHPARSRWLLPWWYLHRAAAGVWKTTRS